ncbi:hypothetical protein BDV98DRAFT_607481 [Pterulicium gracile]|uniref:Integral membrane protein n=1 Tax=Pterulicium gracile TaxID=1884261 RepID=A0A5C3Q666_9AGAR|nr:hypothetical protein BDV98DRAFT_607481 [Pterula gracilis]
MDSTTQDPAVIQTLEMISGLAELVYPQVLVAIVVMALFGVYFVLSSIALWSLLRRKRKNHILLGALGITAAATILHSSLIIALPLAQIKGLLMRASSVPLLQRYEDYQSSGLQKMSYPTMIIVGGSADAGLVFLVNNALAVWRALSLWSSPTQGVVSLLLWSLLAANAGLYPPLIYMTIKQTKDLSSSASAHFSSDRTLFALVTAQSSVSILVNALATGIIAYKAFEHKRFESRAGTRLIGAKLLLLLTESGVFYILIQIVHLILVCLLVLPAFKNDPSQWLEVGKATMIFQFSSVIICAMYPPALTLIINYCYTTRRTKVNEMTPPTTLLPSSMRLGSRPGSFHHHDVHGTGNESTISFTPSSWFDEQKHPTPPMPEYRSSRGTTDINGREYLGPIAF